MTRKGFEQEERRVCVEYLNERFREIILARQMERPLIAVMIRKGSEYRMHIWETKQYYKTDEGYEILLPTTSFECKQQHKTDDNRIYNTAN